MRIRQEQLDAFQAQANRGTSTELLRALEESHISASRDAASGDVLISDRRGSKSRVSFGDDGLVQEFRRPSGEAQRFKHDVQGRLTGIHHSGGPEWRYQYGSGDKLEKFEVAGHANYQLRYDKSGRLDALTHPDGKTEAFVRDANGQVIRHTSRSGAVTQLKATPNTDRRTDPLGRTVEYRLSDTGLLDTVMFPDGTSESYGIDPETGQSVVRQRSGQLIEYGVDEEGRPSRILWKDGSALELGFDDLGRPVTARNTSDDVAFTYDGQGHLEQESSRAGTVRHAYDPDGRPIALITQHGEELRFHYDDDGRLVAVEDWDHRRIEIDPSPSGLPARIRFPNGIVETWSVSGEEPVEVVGSLLGPGGHLISRQAVTLDSCDRVRSVAARWGDGPDERATRRLDYDNELRLTAETDAATGELLAHYAYDAAGNMLRDTDVPVSFGPMDNPVARGGNRIGQDGLGNLTSLIGRGGELRLSFSADSRLQTAAVGNKAFQYSYDGLCRRVLKTDGVSTWTYGWAGFQLLWEEYRSGPGAKPVRRDYLHLPGCVVPMAFRENGSTYWIQSDHRGAVIAVHDESGQLAWHGVYDGFGHVRIAVSEVRQPWRLSGQYFDDETGLHYNLVRYYSPELKSYLSLDPRWQEPEASKYSYCRNDPWNRADPVGMLGPILVGAIAVAAAGLISGGIAAYNSPEGEGLSAFGKGFVVGAGAALVGIGTALALPSIGIAATAVAAFATIGAVEGAASSILEDAVSGRPICVQCAVTATVLGAVLGVVIPAVGGVLSRRFSQSALGKAKQLPHVADQPAKATGPPPTSHMEEAEAVGKRLPLQAQYPVKTEPNEARFWSGVGGPTKAKELAGREGKTLEMVLEERGITMPDYDPTKPGTVRAWEEVSAQFASEASGEVKAFVKRPLRNGNIWENIERDRLKANPKVTKIIEVDVTTGAETVVFSR